MKEDIIDNYKRLPIGKWLEIQKIVKDESLDGLEQQAGIISVLTDIPVKDILDLPIPDYTEMANHTRFLETAPKDISAQIAKEYAMGDLVLVPVMDTRKVTMAQFADFQEWAKMGDERLVETLSCLMIPKGKKYLQDYDILDVQDAIRNYLSVSDVLAIAAFFLTSSIEYIHNSLICSRKEAMRIPELERRQMMLQRIEEQEILLRKSGVGLPM